MRVYQRHRWDMSYSEASFLQHELRKRVRFRPLSLGKIRYVAGADIAIRKSKSQLISAVCVHQFPGLDMIETRVAVTRLTFPYIPGLLSFREIPSLIACLQKVISRVDVVLCDGHGIAHPRGLGLASHLGLLLRKPTIGCAKSVLVGTYGNLGRERGDYCPLVYEGSRVGSVLRTREGVKPVFVSPGHLIDQASSRRVVLACSGKYRLPEPIRSADRLAGVEKRRLVLDASRTET
ncbi:MAG: deoxyribonuclease V [Candidatus Krumholzibacteria bacterium]|nr:deoxyribonuclease V [Candidatus Krumholzibacteria bacterium]